MDESKGELSGIKKKKHSSRGTLASSGLMGMQALKDIGKQWAPMEDVTRQVARHSAMIENMVTMQSTEIPSLGLSLQDLSQGVLEDIERNQVGIRNLFGDTSSSLEKMGKMVTMQSTEIPSLGLSLQDLSQGVREDIERNQAVVGNIFRGAASGLAMAEAFGVKPWADLMYMDQATPPIYDQMLRDIARPNLTGRYPRQLDVGEQVSPSPDELDGVVLSNDEGLLIPAYAKLRRVEPMIRRFIESKLREAYGLKWWKQGVPDRVRQKCEERMQGKKYGIGASQSDMDYAGIDDYKTIIVAGNNWDKVFSAIFIDKKIVEVYFEFLNRVRVAVAHLRPIRQIHFRMYETTVDWLEDTIERN